MQTPAEKHKEVLNGASRERGVTVVQIIDQIMSGMPPIQTLRVSGRNLGPFTWEQGCANT